MTPTSQTLCRHNNTFECSNKRLQYSTINVVEMQMIQRYFIEKKQQPKLHLFRVDKTFQTIRIMEMNPHATELIFHTPVPASKMQLFHT